MIEEQIKSTLGRELNRGWNVGPRGMDGGTSKSVRTIEQASHIYEWC